MKATELVNGNVVYKIIPGSIVKGLAYEGIGFDHYFVTSAPMPGTGCKYFFFSYLGHIINKKEAKGKVLTLSTTSREFLSISNYFTSLGECAADTKEAYFDSLSPYLSEGVKVHNLDIDSYVFVVAVPNDTEEKMYTWVKQRLPSSFNLNSYHHNLCINKIVKVEEELLEIEKFKVSFIPNKLHLTCIAFESGNLEVPISSIKETYHWSRERVRPVSYTKSVELFGNKKLKSLLVDKIQGSPITEGLQATYEVITCRKDGKNRVVANVHAPVNESSVHTRFALEDLEASYKLDLTNLKSSDLLLIIPKPPRYNRERITEVICKDHQRYRGKFNSNVPYAVKVRVPRTGSGGIIIKGSYKFEIKSEKGIVCIDDKSLRKHFKVTNRK